MVDLGRDDVFSGASSVDDGTGDSNALLSVESNNDDDGAPSNASHACNGEEKQENDKEDSLFSFSVSPNTASGEKDQNHDADLKVDSMVGKNIQPNGQSPDHTKPKQPTMNNIDNFGKTSAKDNTKSDVVSNPSGGESHCTEDNKNDSQAAKLTYEATNTELQGNFYNRRKDNTRFSGDSNRNDNFSSSSSVADSSIRSTPVQSSRSSALKKAKGQRSVPLKSTSFSDRTSLLSRGMSLFAKMPSTPQLLSSYKNENDASSVSSEISRGAKSISTIRSTIEIGEENHKRHLEQAGLMLVKRLIEFLSECPPAPDEDANISFSVDSRVKSHRQGKRASSSSANKQRKKQRGLTLPASAVGWISSQIYRKEEGGVDSKNIDNIVIDGIGDCFQVPVQQLQCLQTLLRRVTSLRISRESWPPPIASSAVAAADGKPSFATIPERQSLSTRIMSHLLTDQSVMGDDFEEESCVAAVTRSDGNDEQQTNVSNFQRYYHGIQHKPEVNMSLFPNATKVVIDGIPPGWVSNLDSLKNLEMFQMEKGCLLDINLLFFPSDTSHDDAERLASSQGHQFVYNSLSKLRLSNCAIGETAGLRGRLLASSIESKPISSDENISSRAPTPTFSRFPNLVSLNLSHNEIFRTKTALAGLSSLPFLSSINLSHNRLKSMQDVFLHIGNVKELILTGNELSSTRGLDRLYALERLSLSENKIQNLANVAGIAKLPFLMNLDVKGNPLEIDDPTSCRIKVLNLFREVRCQKMPKNATFRDMQQLLPILDNEVATKDELIALKDLTFRQAAPSASVWTPPFTSGSQPDDIDAEIGEKEQTEDKTDFNDIAVSIPGEINGIRRVTRISSSRNAHVRIAGLKLLEDRADWRLKRFHNRVDRRIGNGSRHKTAKKESLFLFEDLIASIRPETVESDSSLGDDADNTADIDGPKLGSFPSHQSHSKLDDSSVNSCANKPFPYSLPADLLQDSNDDVWDPSLRADTQIYRGTPSSDDIQLVAVNDESKSVVSETSFDNDSHKVDEGPAAQFSENKTGIELPSPLPEDETSAQNNSNDEVDDAISELMPRNSIFGGIWEQAYRNNVAPINTGAETADTADAIAPSGILDFTAEESNALYDGPPDYSTLFVSNDLDLYYDSYVFPSDSKEDDTQEAASRKGILMPRIQLYKFDRNLLIESKGPVIPSSSDFFERYVGVWREDVLACGPYAKMRLPPLAHQKRGFHGETMTQAGNDVMVSESRKFVLCLSDSAFYFILDDDVSPSGGTVSKDNDANGQQPRPFPSRVPPNAVFGDAYWPHALMRHSLQCLQKITIGFQFQRLILRFSVPSPNTTDTESQSLDYVYVLLTSNKLRTISLLQKIQSNLSDHLGTTTEEEKQIIENDDKIFLDALGTKTDEVVLHYQILRQFWKRGDREAARRAFVLTDSQVYLLDETYFGDGTESDDEGSEGRKRKSKTKNLGEVSLNIIDSASLSRVTEVRAANEDPRMITLVILPLNKLKRSHRWRLVCNDGEGAEQLIDEVRRAMRAAT